MHLDETGKAHENIKVVMNPAESRMTVFLDMEEKRANEAQLKDKIPKEQYFAYFNYNLSPQTWNLLVNKQIYMKFERLFIEKHLAERRRREVEALS